MDTNTMIVFVVGIIVGGLLLYGLFKSSAGSFILEKFGIKVEKKEKTNTLDNNTRSSIKKNKLRGDKNSVSGNKGSTIEGNDLG